MPLDGRSVDCQCILVATTKFLSTILWCRGTHGLSILLHWVSHSCQRLIYCPVMKLSCLVFKSQELNRHSIVPLLVLWSVCCGFHER